jgi:acetyl esterase/lipase
VLPDSLEDEERIISVLRETTAATIARINYRLSPAQQFPTAYHDVLFAYDWIRDHLVRDAFQRPYLARLGVCGELIGGSLATMLGLTECRLGETRIVVGAVNNPIVDWVFPDELPTVDPALLPEPLAPDETALPADEDPMATVETTVSDLTRKPRKRPPKAPVITAWQRYGDNPAIPTLTLSAERDVLFRKPEHTFDRFASPIHFFRSPHAQMTQPQQDDIFASRQPDDLDIETQMSVDHYASVNTQPAPAPEPELPMLTRCRAYTRHYPPAGTNLKLPQWYITTGDESPLLDQSTELTKMLRRSVARQALKTHSGRTRWHDANEKKMYEEQAEERVQLNTLSGIGLWTQHGEKEDSMHNVYDVGLWMRQRLDIGST